MISILKFQSYFLCILHDHYGILLYLVWVLVPSVHCYNCQYHTSKVDFNIAPYTIMLGYITIRIPRMAILLRIDLLAMQVVGF